MKRGVLLLRPLCHFSAWLFLTNSVCEPAVEERLVGWPALGEAEVALALEGLDRAQQHGFAAASTAAGQKRVDRGERIRADAAIRRQVWIVGRVAVERGQCALEEGNGARRAHVHAGVEQLG